VTLLNYALFRDGAERVGKVVPFSTFECQDPADFWKYMDAYAGRPGPRFWRSRTAAT